MAKRLPASFHCATEFTLAVLGGKWKTVILCYLKQRPCRYSELRKLLPRVSDKVLTERLRDLVAAGLIVHRKRGGRSGADIYALAPRGRSLHLILHHLYAWGQDNATKFQVAVGEPLRVMDAEKPER
jgi:DNA-binding HxlR family transcriptional regulator